MIFLHIFHYDLPPLKVAYPVYPCMDVCVCVCVFPFINNQKKKQL